MSPGEGFERATPTLRQSSVRITIRISVNAIVLGSPAVSAIVAMFIVLVVGDFASTFFYHVPQHVWGKLHLRTHHDRKRSYWDHAVISRNPEILLDGFLGALPYMLIAVACARISIPGAAAGLVLGQLHVWWRHTCELGWVSPAWVVRRRRVIPSSCPKTTTSTTRTPKSNSATFSAFTTFRRVARHRVTHDLGPVWSPSSARFPLAAAMSPPCGRCGVSQRRAPPSCAGSNNESR